MRARNQDPPPVHRSLCSGVNAASRGKLQANPLLFHPPGWRRFMLPWTGDPSASCSCQSLGLPQPFRVIPGIYSLTHHEIFVKLINTSSYSSSSTGTTAHCGLWPVEQCPSIFSYLPPTLSIFSLAALEDLVLLLLSIFSWVFPFFSSLPVLEWRCFWASYPPPFSPGVLTSLSFAHIHFTIFLLCPSLLVPDSSDFSIPRFHI